MTKKELSAEYNRIYDEANRVFKKHNPCQFKDGRCVSNRRYLATKTRDGCCSCSKLGPNGCKVKALGCKLWTCRIIIEKHKKCATEIEQLRRLARKIFGCMPTIYTAKGSFFSAYYSRKGG